MKRLTKKQAADYNKLHEAVQTAANGLNEARAEFESFREDIFAEAESYFDEKSERWQEGEAGEAYSAWRDEWQEECCDEAEDPREYPEEPES